MAAPVAAQQQVQAAPAPAQSPAGLMQQQPAAPARQARQRPRGQAQGAAVRRARQQASAKPAKKGGASTGIFIGVAAVLGAAIAWAAMKYLA